MHIVIVLISLADGLSTRRIIHLVFFEATL